MLKALRLTRPDLRDLLAMFITGRCWVCGQDEHDPGMVVSLGTHLAMHRSDPPGWYPGWRNPVIQPPVRQTAETLLATLHALRALAGRPGSRDA